MISPHVINTKERWIGSVFGTAEMEMVARNLVILKKMDDGWSPISWDEYCERCTHEINEFDRVGWKQLQEEGYMDISDDGESYDFTESFMEAIKQFENV